jgi:hypothetical protein
MLEIHALPDPKEPTMARWNFQVNCQARQGERFVCIQGLLYTANTEPKSKTFDAASGVRSPAPEKNNIVK